MNFHNINHLLFLNLVVFACEYTMHFDIDVGIEIAEWNKKFVFFGKKLTSLNVDLW